MTDSEKPKTILPWPLPGSHWLGDEECDNILEVINCGSLNRYYGPEHNHFVDRLEHAFCDKYFAPHALAVSSGSSALHIALAALGIGPGDEVLLPGYLWASCLSAIIRCGAIPRLVDIDDTFCMCPDDLSRKINKRSKAILLIHMSGAPGHIDKIAAIAKQHKLPLIEDCAQALNAHFKGQPVGSFGDAAIFSLTSTKNISCGEGGIILCKDREYYQRCFAIHDVGYARSHTGIPDFEQSSQQLWGIGARMSELSAAVALAQLAKVDKITNAMHHAKWQIRNALSQQQGLSFRHIVDPQGDSGPYLIIQFESNQACLQFTTTLATHGLEMPQGIPACIPMSAWGLHWYFNNLSLVNKCANDAGGFPWTHPENHFAKDIDYSIGTLPVCDELAQRSAIMPIASNLTDADCQVIISAFKDAANEGL